MQGRLPQQPTCAGIRANETVTPALGSGLMQQGQDLESKLVGTPPSPIQCNTPCLLLPTASSTTAMPSGAVSPPQGRMGPMGPSKRRRILVTGATGLLGRQVMESLGGGSWEVRGLCHSRKQKQPPCIVACDLTVEGAPAAQIDEFRPHIVIHLAAEWRPDVLRRSPARARQLNVDVSGAVAAACERCGAWLIYVSADCVFDGRAPPYTVDSPTNPLSEYGWHKLHGEQLTLAGCPGAAVLRVPLLYGPFNSVTDSAVISLYTDLKNGVKEVDAWQQCYPTWTGDVAGVIRAMMNLHLSGECVHGIFHWQNDEPFTWHEMMLLVAEICGMDVSNIRAVHTAPSVPLPKDTRLDCSRLEGLVDASQFRMSFREGLRACLESFCLTRIPSFHVEGEAIPCNSHHRSKETTGATVSDDPERELRDELRARGAALQELFWQELERTRNRLREAGFVNSGKMHLSDFQKSNSLATKAVQNRQLSDSALGSVAGNEAPWGCAEPSRRGSPRHSCKYGFSSGTTGTLHFLSEQRV